MQNLQVICFYTRNTPYEQEVKTLCSSCDRFGIPIVVEAKESLGSWEKNVAMKPAFILEQMEKWECPLLWVDVDAIFLKKPDCTPFLEGDIAVRFMEIFQDKPEHAVNAATLFVNQTKQAKDFVEKWVERSDALFAKNASAFVDQIALYEVLSENKEAKVLPLPVSYCKIFDLDSFFIDDEEVVIEQRQASRKYRCAY